MKICIPITEDQGLQSPVCPHFGSTPMFLAVDTDTGTCRTIPNDHAHHGHGQCMPIQALQGEALDAIVVGGIGAGALSKLMAAGLQVYVTEQATAQEVLGAFKAGTLKIMTANMACAHHGHGHNRP